MAVDSLNDNSLSLDEVLLGKAFSLREFVIRLVLPGDESIMCRFYSDNKPHLQPWEPTREDHFYTDAGWGERIHLLTQAHRHKIAFSFIIIEPQSGEVVGTINYTNLLGFPFHACHLGYALAAQYQGQGIMYAALQVTNAWLLQQLHVHRLMAAYIPHNQRSGNLLKRLGFVEEGLAKQYLLINGQWQDHVLTSLINPNW